MLNLKSRFAITYQYLSKDNAKYPPNSSSKALVLISAMNDPVLVRLSVHKIKMVEAARILSIH